MISEQVLKEVEAVARQAGAAIMKYYEANDFATRIAVQAKGDESPLTLADLAAHEIIHTQLTNISNDTLANLPQLSEESAAISWKERQNWQTYWLIDPLDGTKEFIKRNGEFTVNIALIHQHQPVAGVVYAPAIDTMYSAAQQLGAFKNSTPIWARQNPDPEKLKVVGSRSHQSPDMQAYLDKLKQPYEMVPMGSSLKLCLIAESAADLYPRLGPTSEWDTAAAHAIVLAAGGEVNTLEHKPLSYSTKESLLNPHLIAK
ncbi:3'(2'),5'-bisphosphate nucleotidase CysQ [Pseudidiomarina halophila]|uniref:3'(2'),5'-bisphosphate nucleotidase CysQ n=1 Tax=Pseudidiomarina halophila TaxID=1449799 RepID=A0A432XZ99_9GAMM|nr:3'(2'),5'-bisphosphate nucleotidase CysQ [Pseudidiomarina halophila]RUO53901.1 3'(2'),5'-bisphosphate nucleotidase [Pseudidiomarina halophila]